MSADVAYLITQKGLAADHWITVEQGLHNGVLMTGDLFGIASNPVAISSSASQFDFYSGGGLAQTFLGWPSSISTATSTSRISAAA